MPRKSRNSRIDAKDYRHSAEKRKNIPLAKIAAEGEIPKVKRARYYYSPHLDPLLLFDPTNEADRLFGIFEKVTRHVTEHEGELLKSVAQDHDPWLEWAGKREEQQRGWFGVDPIALHIHERVSAQAVVRTAMREDVQRELFADPELPYQNEVQFYQHDIDWTNRLILGDSLQVMSSLARRENLAGKVQMIYIDPPYGIRFAVNFQPEVRNRVVTEKIQDLSREPEMVKAYRDSWTLGVHSYLSYLRERLLVCRELLADEGSIFVQIGDENLHRVQCLLDEVFRNANWRATISVRKTLPLGSEGLTGVTDYVLWYAKDKERLKERTLTREREVGLDTPYRYVIEETGLIRKISTEEEEQLKKGKIVDNIFRYDKLESSGYTQSCFYDFEFEGRNIPAQKKSWRTNPEGMRRLIGAGRVVQSPAGSKPSYLLLAADSYGMALHNLWADLQGAKDPIYVVQTNEEIARRCLLMTTDPGDLVLDPTCGSGTTAYVAENWGRRWITIDTSRVAIAIARQRLLTAKYEYYKLRDSAKGPRGGLCNRTVPNMTPKSIAQNANLDPIIDRYQVILDRALASCNTSLQHVTGDLRDRLSLKIFEKQKREGKRAITDADRRRWQLPKKGEKWKHWEVPFDFDPEWPKALQEAVGAYSKFWQEKMEEINATIKANAEQEELEDQAQTIDNILRVCGPFTVEGVRPEELSIGEEGLFDGTPNELEKGTTEVRNEVQNLRAYLSRMVALIRKDGVTFPNNKHRNFARVESLFEQRTGAPIHAEGSWEGTSELQPNSVVIGFGPQYGPVTAEQVEDLIRASKRYDELVIAGFSFDGEAAVAIQEAKHPKLKIHMVHVRPDVSPGMDGLLKETPNSQLFTVFGQPEIEVRKRGEEEFQVELLGVDIFDPLRGEVRSTGAEKVAAWFLDSDYDGRCFCITQAFFPDQDAWQKIAKALGSQAEPEAFEAFKGTFSIPFKPGKHKRIAVKVIDPRGNEVMVFAPLAN
jgi:adenine-specific DNA-methyltransferase